MRKTLQIACAVLCLAYAPAQAGEEILAAVPQAQEVGQARMTYMLWDVYDVALYAPNGQWQPDQPYALELSYLRSLDGDKIADRSVEEIRKQGFSDEVKLATWHTQMRDIFPDVKEGTILTGVFESNGDTVFYNGKTAIGRIEDPDFGKAFFGIWLDEKTSEPDLRRALLALP